MRYDPLFYRGSPASIPQVVAHIQRTLTEEDPEYTPLRQRMPPASIPDIVAHIQKFLSENDFMTMTDLGAQIAEYIEAHPEIVGVFTVNGSAGNVLLDASDIPIETGEDPTVAGAIAYLSSQLALLVANAVLSVNGVDPDDSHNVTLTGANIPQDGSTTKKLSETFGPATSSSAGSKGLVPAPAAGEEDYVLNGSGTWVPQPTGSVQTVCNVGPNSQGNVPLTGSAIPSSVTDNNPISTTLNNLNTQIVNLGPIATLTSESNTAALAASQGKALKTLLDKLNTYEVLVDYVDTYNTHRYIYRVGNVIVAKLYNNSTNTEIPAGEHTTPYTIPESYRPRVDIINMSISQTKQPVSFTIGTNGSVKFWKYDGGIPGQIFIVTTWSVSLSSL